MLSVLRLTAKGMVARRLLTSIISSLLLNTGGESDKLAGHLATPETPTKPFRYIFTRNSDDVCHSRAAKIFF